MAHVEAIVQCGSCYTQSVVMQAFFADIYIEAKRAKPGAGHQAIAALAAAGKLQRHYTLNIDGLASSAGMSTWHHQVSPEGAPACLRTTRFCSMRSASSLVGF